MSLFVKSLVSSKVVQGKENQRASHAESFIPDSQQSCCWYIHNLLCLLAAAKATKLAFQVFYSSLLDICDPAKGFPDLPTVFTLRLASLCSGKHRQIDIQTDRWKQTRTAEVALQNPAQIDARRSQFFEPWEVGA